MSGRDRSADSLQVHWNGLESGSRETCEFVIADAGITVHGVIDDHEYGRCEYRAVLDAAWRFRSLAIGLSGRSLHIEFDGTSWSADGERRDDLRGAQEIDLSASPVTNSFPIRRLGLPVGGSADIVTAWVEVPALTVVPDPQRYTRLGVAEYLFQSRDSDFERIITVDESGLVIDYPGMFERG